MKKLKINIKGRVQGVGFRYTTKMVADELGVTGAVWNEDDGSVSIEAVADDAVMKLFLQRLKASPSPSGKVSEMTVEEAPELKEGKKFNVSYR
ncbi:acylphosphatase [Enterococcus sp. HY326]|uniref:acylphosphatase n=1 Tax=Enterococcus sp. HY326 TaxID=2971265 RepID=UPI00223E9397|nr:acylphosphatase [Enterococcus sp. HY326]